MTYERLAFLNYSNSLLRASADTKEKYKKCYQIQRKNGIAKATPRKINIVFYKKLLSRKYLLAKNSLWAVLKNYKSSRDLNSYPLSLAESIISASAFALSGETA